MSSPYNSIPSIPPAFFESHLSILMNNNGETKPLWGATEELQQEYFEIEILTDKNEDTFQKSMDDILNMNKYTCHMCNIDVPKTYIKEHNNSSKHKTCNEIANLALERTKLQKQLDVTVARKVEVADTYFCEPCSTVVFNSNKKNHKATKIHKISIKHDELLNDLFKIYSDIDNVEVDSEIDELELLQQKIELESLQEESALQNTDDSHDNAETGRFDNKTVQTEVLSVLKTELKSALGSEFKHVADEVSQVREFIDKMRLDTAKLRDRSEALADTINSNKTSRNSKNKAMKKNQIKKKKERFHSNVYAPVEVEKDGNGFENSDVPKDAVRSFEEIAKEASTSENNNGPLDNFSNKIDEIMAKYFATNCTVDALNSNTDREHNKNKLSKELKKNKDNNIVNKENNNDPEKEQNDEYKEIEQNIDNNHVKAQNQEDENTDENKINVEQNESKKENENLSNVKQSKNMEQNITSKEQNSNKNTDQNVNNNEQNNNKNTEYNKNKNQNTNKKSNDQMKNKVKTEQEKNKSIKDASKSNKSNAPSFNLVYYLKDISRRCETKPIHTVEAITDTIVQITAINGDKIKVLLNNFHSFHVKSNDIYCKVCESPNVRRPEWHIIESDHRGKVMLPIKDQNGMRQLDDIWSHCVLCNDLTKNIEFHLQSVLHRNKLKHCLVELGNQDADSDDDQSDVNEEQNVVKRQTSDKHGPTITALVLKNNLAMTSKNYLKCNICDVIVNYDLRSVQQHVTSFDHLNNFELEQIENKLIDIDSERFYCIGCDVNISKFDIVSHCKGKRHQKLLQELLIKQGEDLENEADGTEIALPSISQNIKKQCKDKIDDSELICFVCNVILYCIDEHMDSFEHKKSYYSYLEANKLNEIEADTFYCIPCNLVITIDYLMSHCTGRKHKTILKNFIGNKTEGNEENIQKGRDGNKNKNSTPSTSQIPLKDKTMRLKVLYQFREMTDPNKLLCTVCDEEVVYNRKVAEYHVSTLDHVVAFNLMMLWNKIKKRDDKYFCDICRSDMTYFSEITHVLGKQHATNLAKQPKGTVYEYDRTLVTHAYAMSHKVGDRSRPSSIVSVVKPKQ